MFIGEIGPPECQVLPGALDVTPTGRTGLHRQRHVNCKLLPQLQDLEVGLDPFVDVLADAFRVGSRNCALPRDTEVQVCTATVEADVHVLTVIPPDSVDIAAIDEDELDNL